MANSESDIKTAGSECLSWDQANAAKSLQDLRTFVEDEAKKTTDWYWREKNKKKGPSQRIQRFSLLFTAAAGLTPIIIQVIKNWDETKFKGFDSGPIASLLVGLAAALLGLDKAFGYSTGWVRYVLTATSMTKLLNEFRLDWVAIYSASAAPPTLEEQGKLIQRAKTFVSDVQGLVLQETKDWANEFQSNMAQMEKDVKTQLDALKAQVDKISKEREAAAVPGAIELTVANADKTEGFLYDVVLEGKGGKVSGTATSSKVWTQINTPPGQYKLTVNAKAKGAPVSTSTVFAVEPGQTVKVPLSFDIAP